MSAAGPPGVRNSGHRGHAEFAVALALEVIGAAVVLLAGGRGWQTLRAARPRPLADAVLQVSGRTLDAAPTALAVVALAAAVALLATRSRVRRVIGGIVAGCGGVVCWRACAALAAVGAARARSLLGARAGGLPASSTVHVATHPAWAGLTVVGGVLMLLAGVLTVARAGRRAGLSARYEAPEATDPRAPDAPAPTTLALWNALDRGDDPTDRPSATG